MTHRRAVLILLGCAFVWGASFTLNKMVLDRATPLLYMSLRFGCAAALLTLVYRRTRRDDWRVGIPLGALFAAQLALFVFGLSRIDPGRAAFLFSFQTPLVPVLMLAAHRQRPTRRDMLAVGLATLGAWWLTRPGGSGAGFGLGDVAMLASAVGAACYVVVAGAVTGRHEPLPLLAVQFIAMTVLGGVASMVLETPRIEWSPVTVILIPFLALSSVATFGGQLVGQKLVRPTEASVLYALEPLVAAATAWISLGDRLAPTQWLGGFTILAASLIATIRKAPAVPPASPAV